MSKSAMEEVLQAQSVRISEEASKKMEEDISLGELHLAAKALAKNKVPGKNGVHVEFYL